MKRFDNPWRNPKLIWGAGLLLGIIGLGLLGRLFWDTRPGLHRLRHAEAAARGV
jgi:hypothetical protein